MNRATEKYTYISHPDNLPLEVNGKAKKRGTPIKKQEYNGNRASINEDSRSFLMKKLANNIHDLDNLKSVLPSERKKSRPNSIKTFTEDRDSLKSSGVEYLMQKTEGLKASYHNERSHISEFLPVDLNRPEKKHYANENIETIGIEGRKQKSHKQTSDIRIANDIYSNVYRAEKENQPSKKIESANLFRGGAELGLEKKREKKVSESKIIEMIGSENSNNRQVGLRQRRQDWRISNINFF